MLPDHQKDRWLDTAVSGIRFKPDRKAVRAELEAHMEDKVADLQRIFPNIPEEEAQERVLSSMGDPEELKISLAKVHRPWLGYLWMASRWVVWGLWMFFLIINMGTHTDFDNSLRGRTGTEVYHRVRGEERVRLGEYTFQITGAACVVRPEGAKDSLQVVLRASSPKFWARIDTDAVLEYLSAAGPDGVWYAVKEDEDLRRYTVADELSNSYTYGYFYTGGRLCGWGACWREVAVFIPAEGWEPGDTVTLALDSPLGRIELSVPVTEEVRA